MKWLGYAYLTLAYLVLALSCVSFAHSEDAQEDKPVAQKIFIIKRLQQNISCKYGGQLEREP